MRSNKRLTILSKAEQIALYALPDFNEAQRNEYMNLSEDEQALALDRWLRHTGISDDINKHG